MTRARTLSKIGSDPAIFPGNVNITGVATATTFSGAVNASGISTVGVLTAYSAISADAGIDFSGAQTNLAGMTSETLDSYEEGNYTPEFSFSTGQVGSFTYTNRSASYTKIGRLVTVNIMFLCSGIPTAGTDLQCTLPFAPTDTLVGTTLDHVGSCIAYYAAATGGSYAIGTVGNTYAHIIEQGVDSDGGGGYDSMDFDDIESTFSIRATMSYCTA